MDSQYHPAMQSLTSFYPAGHPPIMPPPPPNLFQPRPLHLQTTGMEYIGNYAEIPDPNQVMTPHQQGSGRSRRRQLIAGEPVKHRRTRSGCYTCRQRRVKCDETRPICERCQKGKRDCAYPGSSSSSSRAARRDSKSKATDDSETSPSGDENDGDEKMSLSAIPDDEDDIDVDDAEPPSAASDSQYGDKAATWSSSKTITPVSESSASSRAVRPSVSRTTSKQSVRADVFHHPRWSTLTREDRAFLKYHQETLSHHHYAFKYDAGDFLKTTFLEIAMNDESQALLYAVIAFASYHRSIERADFKISVFLSYYNKSIMLLQQSLKTKRPSITTLLTVLQLATIEEFLGDWTNLLGHQKAAHQILTDLFNPDTIMQDETRRRIIAWYIRFDLFAGMMSGSETSLGREWFAACQEHYSRQARDRPDDLGAQFEDYFSTSRLLATDVALLFANKVSGAISDDQFAATSQDLMAQFASFEKQLHSVFTDPLNYVKTFPKAPPPSPDDITNFRDPWFLRTGECFTMNFVLLDFWAIDLMFKFNMANVQGVKSPELLTIALKSCKMFEAIQYCDQGPPGAITGCQASLGIASLFLPKDEKHTNWCRQKFALIEQTGYIYPPSLRQQLTKAWNVDVTEWWLPNDQGYPDIIRAIREFVHYRASVPKDSIEAAVRDMSGILPSLQKMNVEELSGSSSVGGTDTEQFSPVSAGGAVGGGGGAIGGGWMEGSPEKGPWKVGSTRTK